MNRKLCIRLLAGSIALLLLSYALGAPTRVHAACGANCIVVDTNDDSLGVCDFSVAIYLRCAINYANANPGTEIVFASYITTVNLLSALPAITAAGTWIDGTDGNGGYVGPTIIGWPRGTSGDGFTINASNVTISNLQIVQIPGGDDIHITGGKGIKIAYNHIGILTGATSCPLQSSIGVGISNDNAGGGANAADGTAYIYGNTISCQGGSGIEIIGSNYVYIGLDTAGAEAGNNIGTTANGLGAAGNGSSGVRIAMNSDSVTIRKNLIAYNSTAGVSFDGSNITLLFNTISANGHGLLIGSGSGQLVVANNIGTSVNGLLPWPNTYEGVLIVNGSGLSMSDNLVAYNGGAGIAVIGSTTHASIQNNNTYGNRGLPIDLGDDGATVNGSRSLPGPNDWLPYPVVTTHSGSLIVGTKCVGCGVFIYKAIGNPATPGGGGIYVTNVVADSNSTWNATLPNGLTVADVSFTAVGAGHNSSEMSPRPVLFLPLIRR